MAKRPYDVMFGDSRVVRKYLTDAEAKKYGGRALLIHTSEGHNHLCELLKEMVMDEKKAYTHDYPRLLRAGKGKVPKRFFKDIRRNIKDEHRHHGVVDGYYRYICGKQR